MTWIEKEQNKIKARLQELERLPEVTEENRRAKQLAMLPASLRQSDGAILIPQARNRSLYGISAFHDPYILPQANRRLERVQQNQMAAIRYTQPSTTQDLSVASRGWQKDGPGWLETMENYQSWSKQERRALMNLMARPRGSFEWGAARILGLAAAGAMGSLLVADLLGGYLGMALLRRRRRRRAGRIGLGA